MKKIIAFFKNHKAAILAFLLALFGAEAVDIGQDYNVVPSTAGQSDTGKTEPVAPATNQYLVITYWKQAGTPDKLQYPIVIESKKYPDLNDSFIEKAVRKDIPEWITENRYELYHVTKAIQIE